VATAPSAPHTREAASRSTPAATVSTPAVDVTALTSRDDFLLELGQTLGGQAAVRPVETIEAAMPHLASKRRGQVLVIDARGVADLRSAAERAHREAPQAVLLVFSETSGEAQTAAALRGTRVFAVLPLPVDPRKTQALFEGAVAEAQQRRQAAPASPAPAPAAHSADLSIAAFRPAPAAAAHEAQDSASGGRGRLLLIGLAVAAAVALAAGAGWYFIYSKPTAAPATPAAASRQPPAPTAAASPATPAADAEAPLADTSILKGKVDELLEKARLAMHERRYAEPNGDNALLYYRSVIAEEPNNGEAHDGLGRVAAVLSQRFDEALTASRFDEAALVLASLRLAVPADPRVANDTQRLAVAQISRALADGNFDRAAVLVQRAQQSGSVPAEQITRWRAELARHQEDARVQHLAGLAAERLRDGRLDDGDDSARSYVQQLTAIAPANPATTRASHDLIAAYLHKAALAGAARNNVEQDRWLNAARAAGVKSTELAAFQRELASTRAKAAQAENERLAGLARERIASGALTDPAQDSAAYYLTQLQTSAPADPALAQASHDLAGKLLDRARASIGAGKPADADLAAARRFGADPAALAAVQQLASAPKAAANQAVNAAALAGKLKQTRMVNPEYPAKALNSKIAGSVVLTFTVDTSGVTRDVHVVEASPPGVFDDAALSAVKRWRYAPVVVDGAPVAVPVKTKMLFELPK
jgi:protein TonB